jgi:hypothetical protein
MSMNDHDKLAVARQYFERADQGRSVVLELLHEDAEIYFPKFGIASGRDSLFEMVSGFQGSLESIRHDYDTLRFRRQTQVLRTSFVHEGERAGRSSVPCVSRNDVERGLQLHLKRLIHCATSPG